MKSYWEFLGEFFVGLGVFLVSPILVLFVTALLGCLLIAGEVPKRWPRWTRWVQILLGIVILAFSVSLIPYFSTVGMHPLYWESTR